MFDLSRGSTRSTVSSDNGVYPLHASESDALVPDYDILEEGESAADEPVFVEPRVRVVPLTIKIFCDYSGGSLPCFVIFHFTHYFMLPLLSFSLASLDTRYL